MTEALTRKLAEDNTAYKYADLPDAALTYARHCILDWFGCALAGAGEPLSGILVDEFTNNTGSNSLVGHGARAGLIDSALINGATSHALDFDDTITSMMGHATVAIFPAVLALAEKTGASGEKVMEAFVAGFETACRIGMLTFPTHYTAGFHNTGTVGTFGAAAAASRLMDLTAEETVMALGLAGAQAAGMKSMFGTMTKPLHAGKAAANGLTAARLAARGYTSNPEVLETKQGFLATQTSHDPRALDDPSPGAHIQNNLFKYHAACYLTHSSIEAVQQLRDEHGLKPDDVESVALHVPEGHLGVCNIEEPRTGLETKFSLRQCAAFALHELDTAELGTYSDVNAVQDELVATRRQVRVVGDFPASTAARVEVLMKSGEVFDKTVDVGVPATDLEAQEARLTTKFESLVVPLLGEDRTRELESRLLGFDALANVSPVLSISQPN